MSANGNGTNGNEKSPEGTPVQFMPGKHGGKLRRGGSNGGAGGRPPSAVREKLRGAAWKRIKELERIADASEHDGDRLRALDLMFKYGLGTTVTETDTEGHDVIRVIREPRILFGDR